MVEPCDDGGQGVAQPNEIDHHAVCIGTAEDLTGNGPVVPVHWLTDLVGQGDEVTRGKNVNSFSHGNAVMVGHEWSLPGGTLGD